MVAAARRTNHPSHVDVKLRGKVHALSYCGGRIARRPLGPGSAGGPASNPDQAKEQVKLNPVSQSAYLLQ